MLVDLNSETLTEVIFSQWAEATKSADGEEDPPQSNLST
jgi:hypothetical protein